MICDVPIKVLPACDIAKVETWCDVCIKKGDEKQPANIYCTLCKKKFCTKHEEVREYTGLL